MAVINRSSAHLRLSLWQQALFLLSFVLVAEVAGFSQPLVSLFSRVAAPVKALWVGSLSAVYGVGQSVVKLPKAAQRIADLELRLAAASASLAELETLRRENEELRFLLDNTDRPMGRTIITAPIIAFARPAIAVGSQAGVRVGAVVLSRNTLLGQVSVVSEYESQVVLLSEQDSAPVLAKTESGVEGLIIGDGRKILLSQVAKESVLKVGERVVTVGQPQIEQNLPIGTVVAVINDPVASVQSAVIEPFASFFETPIVEVH